MKVRITVKLLQDDGTLVHVVRHKIKNFKGDAREEVTRVMANPRFQSRIQVFDAIANNMVSPVAADESTDEVVIDAGQGV